MKRKKSLLPLFFLALFLFIQGSYVLFLGINQLSKNLNRHKTLQENKDLKQFIFSEKDLFLNTPGIKWKDKNKELLVDGSYYEVVLIRNLKSKVIVFAIEDYNENHSLAHSIKLHTEKGKGLNNLLKLFNGFVYLPTEKLTSITQKYYQQNNSFCARQGILSGFSTELIKPPGCA